MAEKKPESCILAGVRGVEGPVVFHHESRDGDRPFDTDHYRVDIMTDDGLRVSVPLHDGMWARLRFAEQAGLPGYYLEFGFQLRARATAGEGDITLPDDLACIGPWGPIQETESLEEE